MNMNGMLYRPIFLLALAATAGCGDSGGPSGGAALAFNLAYKPSGAAASPAQFSYSSAPETFTDAAGNTLVLNSVELVLREIELRRSNAGSSCTTGVNDDHCEELQLGPTLLSLPLGTAGPARSFSVAADTGSFSKIEFEIHKPEDDGNAVDQAFLAANPGFAKTSIKVAGTFNGTAFTYTTDLNVEQEISFTTPLTIAAGATTDLTLLVDLDKWFRGATGTLFNPATANNGQSNESRAEESIKNSLKAFEDEDRDGRDD